MTEIIIKQHHRALCTKGWCSPNSYSIFIFHTCLARSWTKPWRLQAFFLYGSSRGEGSLAGTGTL
jgi:hypothetical protein